MRPSISLQQPLSFIRSLLRNGDVHLRLATVMCTRIVRTMVASSALLLATTSLVHAQVDEFEVLDVYGGGTNLHSCALTATNGLKCWGYNLRGQVGNNASTNSNVEEPDNVFSLESGVTMAALGTVHTCAIVSGGVQCWGSNGSGQLADTSITKSKIPIAVNIGAGLSAKTISAGRYSSCVLTTTDEVICWGTSRDGILANGVTTNTATLPVNVTNNIAGTDTVVAIDMGYRHACALLDTTEVKCWGFNRNAQVGNNSSSSPVVTPTYVMIDGTTRLSDVKSIAAGETHTCAVTHAGSVKCWGNNAKGQLGYNSGVVSRVAQEVVGLTGTPIAVETGNRHTCALMDNGDVYCWGDNSLSQLGNRSASNESQTPVKVTGVSKATAIMIGEEHACARIYNGMFCWGENSNWQLGLDTDSYNTAPNAASDQGVVVAGTSIAPPGYFAVHLATPPPSVPPGSVEVTYPGVVPAECPGADARKACYQLPTAGTTITLTATSVDGYSFTGWGGDCDGGQATTTILINDTLAGRASVNCYAHFIKTPYRVIAQVTTHPTPTVHENMGYITVSPMGTANNFRGSCGWSAYDCYEYPPQPFIVTFTATAYPGYRFAGWGHYCDGTNPTASVRIDENLPQPYGYVSCLAYFEVIP